MTVQEKPELTSSHKHDTSTATYGIMLLERDLKTRRTVNLQHGIKEPHQDRQERQRYTLARHGTIHNQEGPQNTELVTKKQGFMPHIKHSQILGPALQRQASKISCFENQWGLHPGKSQNSKEWRVTLNGAHADSPALLTQRKGSSQKST